MISTRSVELVIDTVVCLTLAKWETVSGQFGGYLIMVFPIPMSGIEMFESQFINELIPFIDANYRTQASRDGRAIMGFSGGGQGALRLAFKYPALFSSVEGMSGAVDDNASNVAVNEPQLLAAMFNGDANAFDVQTVGD